MNRKMCLFLSTLLLATSLVVSIPVHAEETTEAPVSINIAEEQVDASKIEDITVKASAPTSVTASSYDPRKNNMVTSVKNQNPYGLCTLYSGIAAAESNLIRQGLADNTIDLSEIFTSYAGYVQENDKTRNFSKNPCGLASLTGFRYEAKPDPCFSLESKYPFPYELVNGKKQNSIPENYCIDNNGLEDYKYKIGRAYNMERYNIHSTESIKELKQLIVNYGGVMACYYNNENYYSKSYSYYFDGDNSYYYPYDDDGTNHQIEIVGWDDNYATSNFLVAPPENGAWLVKNSWGYRGDGTVTGNGSGYFWLSYYDASINYVCAINLIPKDVIPYKTKAYNMEIGSTINLLNDLTDAQLAEAKSILSQEKLDFYMAYTPKDFGDFNYSGTIGKKGKCIEDNYKNEIMRWQFNIHSKSKKLETNFESENTYEVYEDEFHGISKGLTTTLDGVTIPTELLEYSSDNEDVVSMSKGWYTSKDFYINKYGTAKITVSYSDPIITEGETLTTNFTITLKKKPDPYAVMPTPEGNPTPVTPPSTPSTTQAGAGTTTQAPAKANAPVVWVFPKNEKETGKKAKRVVKGKVVYEVKGKVAVVKYLDLAKKDTITILDTVKIKGKKYKVTKIAKNAFSMVNTTKIIIKSKNIKTIGKNAFNVMNKKKLKITVPKGKKEAYYKLIKKSTEGLSIK